MERGSDKHGPRVDEELVRQTQSMERGAPVEARADEGRQSEPGADDQPEPDARPAEGEDLEARSHLARFLEPSAFPGTASELVAAARRQQAPDAVVAVLTALPEDEEFHTVQDVWNRVRPR